MPSLPTSTTSSPTTSTTVKSKLLGSNYLMSSTDHGATWKLLHTFPVTSPAADAGHRSQQFQRRLCRHGQPSVGHRRHLENLRPPGRYASSVWTYLGNGTALPVTATLTTTLTGAVITAGGSGYTSSFAVTFTGGGGTHAAGTANVASGAVTSITITNAGSGYTSAPTINFSAGAGTGAAGQGTRSLAGFANLVGGTGYVGILTGVQLTGGLATGGVAATAHATTTGGSFNLPIVDTAGSGYTSAPTIVLGFRQPAAS